MRRLATLLLLSLLAGLAACDSGDSNEDPTPLSITGTWTGQITSGGVTFSFEMNISESNTFVTGTGFVASPQETVFYALDGSYLHPTISLRLLFSDRFPGQLNGTVTNDRESIRGPVSGPGFSGMIALKKRS